MALQLAYIASFIVSITSTISTTRTTSDQLVYLFNLNTLHDWEIDNYGHGIYIPIHCQTGSCIEMAGDSSINITMTTKEYHTLQILIDATQTNLIHNEYCYMQYKTPSTLWINTNIIGTNVNSTINKEIIIPDNDIYNNQQLFHIKIGNSAQSRDGRCLFGNLRVFGAEYIKTFLPTPNPTEHPRNRIKYTPTSSPTTHNPTQDPTDYPTEQPTKLPTKHPITFKPTQEPTDFPTDYPTQEPTLYPSKSPSKYPTIHPTEFPTIYPTKNPSQTPTKNPTKYPTKYPTKHPTKYPTHYPTKYPTNDPTKYPTIIPTLTPSYNPTFKPTLHPTFTMDSLDSLESTSLITPMPTMYKSHFMSTISETQFHFENDTNDFFERSNHTMDNNSMYLTIGISLTGSLCLIYIAVMIFAAYKKKHKCTNKRKLPDVKYKRPKRKHRSTDDLFEPVPIRKHYSTDEFLADKHQGIEIGHIRKVSINVDIDSDDSSDDKEGNMMTLNINVERYGEDSKNNNDMSDESDDDVLLDYGVNTLLCPRNIDNVSTSPSVSEGINTNY
eukprot:249893_1